MTLAALRLEDHLPATLTAPGLSEAEFLALAEDFPDCFLEYTAEGTVSLTPPTDPASSARLNEILYQLTAWNKRHGKGIVSGSDGGFLFADGSRRSPDAAWYATTRWKEAQRPGTRFPVFAPDFVIKLRSPEQRLRPLQEKMEAYIANGVQLGWLIDPIEHTVAIYAPGLNPRFWTVPRSSQATAPLPVSS